MQKKELGQYPAIFTSHMVNNPYIIRSINGSYPLIEVGGELGNQSTPF